MKCQKNDKPFFQHICFLFSSFLLFFSHFFLSFDLFMLSLFLFFLSFFFFLDPNDFKKDFAFRKKIGLIIFLLYFLFSSFFLFWFFELSFPILKDHVTHFQFSLIFSSFSEECFFRGYLLSQIHSRRQFFVAFFLSLTLFFFAHFPWRANWFPYLGVALLGIVNGLLTLSDKSLLWPTFLHIACNYLGPVWHSSLGSVSRFFFF